jgi:amino acid transporter
MVLASSAPMAAVVATMPAAFAFGTGAATPGAYLFGGIVLALFAVGYVVMSRHITNAGAFYAYVARGVGRPPGMATAMIAIVAYNAMVIAVFGFVGYFTHQVALDLAGINLPWWTWGAIAFAIVAVLAYFEIHLSAKVLGLALTCEIALILAMDFGVLAHHGPAAYPAVSFSPGAVFGAFAGVSIMYAFASFVGFEATAIYGEEARQPRKTVPRATYIAIAFTGLFYAWTAWSLVAAHGPAQVKSVAANHLGTFVQNTNAANLGGFTVDAMSILICTSMFAALLAFHNAGVRYMYALGRDGVLPRVFGRTHPRYGSPFIASAAQIAFTAIIVIIFAVSGVDVLVGFAEPFLGLGTLSIIVLQGLAAYAIVGYFLRNSDKDRRWWNVRIAPTLGALGLTAATILVILNFASLTGSKSPVTTHLWLLDPLAALIGLGLAAWLRWRRGDQVMKRFGMTSVFEEEHTEEAELAEEASGSG